MQACDMEIGEATDEHMTDSNDDCFDEEAEREGAEWRKIENERSSGGSRHQRQGTRHDSQNPL